MLVLYFVVMVIPACNQPGAGRQGSDSEIMNAEKPAIDSSKVLETLALYRAKRYEGIRDAQKAGVEHVNKLVLHREKMGILPPEIGQLTRLSMDKNIIAGIPLQLYELKNLKVLELSDNHLSELPAGIANLSNLTKLDLANNQLTSLPKEITTLSEIMNELNIQGNPIPPEEIQWLIKAMPKTRIRH